MPQRNTNSSDSSRIRDKRARWLVTGGAGFIGCALIRQLVAAGIGHIRILDNLSVGTRLDLARVCSFVEVPAGQTARKETEGSESGVLRKDTRVIELIVGDIRDPEVCLESTRDVDIVAHLAANTGVTPSVENPRYDMEVNVSGTMNMLEAARYHGVRRFVFASSGAPVGECEPPIHEEIAPHPVSPYGASKLAGEAYCSAYFRTFGVETVALRFGNVYGPGSNHKNSVVAKFIRQAFLGETLEVYGDGYQTRDFVYVDDLVRAILRGATVPGIGGEVFQIATNSETTVNTLVIKMLSILSNEGVDSFHVEHRPLRSGDVRRSFSDTSKAISILNWCAEVDLNEGLHRTIRWFLTEQTLETQ